MRTRFLLIAAGVVALTCGAGLMSGSHPQAATVPAFAPAARTTVPSTDAVLALQQAADSAQAAADAHNPRNLVFTSDHSVFAAVGSYSDCTGQAALTHAAAAIDTCVTGVLYFIGHNPGVFSGLMSANVGSLIGYYDGTGRLHRYLVVAERTWLRRNGVPAPAQPGEAAEFQTCVTADGSVDRILDAVEA